MRFLRVAALLHLAVLGATTLGACGLGGVQGADAEDYLSGDGVVTVLPLEERERPGEVAGRTLDGEKLSLDDFAGRVVVVNVWAHWCGPCRAEAPELVEAARLLAEDDVAFVGINTRDPSTGSARGFVREFGLPYPSLVDDGTALLAFAGSLPPMAIPSTVVLDEEGRVAARVVGEVTSSTLVALVEDVRRPA